MKIKVDYDRCESHAQCTLVAPEVFQLDDNGDLQYEENPDDTLRDRMDEAVDICPTQAISIEK